MTNHLFSKKRYILIICVVAISFVAGTWIKTPAIAQDASGIDQSRVQNKFQQIDIDRNGLISLTEMENHEAEKGKTGGNRFSQTDINGDKTISMEEFNQHEIEKGQRDNRQQGEPDNEKRPPAQQQNNLSGLTNRQNIQGQNKYSIEQAVSDRAQLNTIAFNGLAFLTGDFGAATFIPPGKVCDFFGFQYMRDIDAAGKGHNPMFLNRVAGNVLYILNTRQKQMFLDLAGEQAPQMEELAKMRLDLIKAFHMERDQQIPAGSTGLNKDAVIKKVGDIFAKDAELSLKRAKVMASVALSLTPDQKTYLDKMKFGDFNTWPSKDERNQLKRGKKGQSKMFNVAYMTYASEFFSWIAGSVDADVYFCPERHGTYFGGFYMKDMPAMGKRDYDISTAITGNSGERFLDILSQEQQQHVTSIPKIQEDALRKVIDVRQAISMELRKYLKGQTPDKEKVISLGRQYGELDGEMSYLYTIGFSRINQTLSQDQRQKLMSLRNLEGYKSAPYYIYSKPVRKQPVLETADHFFFKL